MDYDRQDGFLGWAGRCPRRADALCLLAIVLFALFFRFVYVAEYMLTPLGIAAVAPDAAAHDSLARQVLAGEASGVPLYPRFLALLYRQGGRGLGIVRNLKLWLDTAALALVWMAVRRLWRRRTACLAGLLWAVYLPLIYYSAELHPDGLAVFLLSLGFFLWTFASRPGGFRAVVLLGIGLCMGLAAAAQPLLLPFAAAAVALGPVLVPGTAPRRARLLAAAWLVPGLLAAFSPLAGSRPTSEWGRAPSAVHNLAYTWSAQEIASGYDLPELQFYTPLMRRPLPRFGWIVPLALFGLWLRRRDSRVWLWALLPAAHALALAFAPLAGGRQRLPMIPALLVLAALGADALVAAWQSREVATWRLATVLLPALFLAVHLLPAPVPPDSAARSLLLVAEASFRIGDLDHAEAHAAGAAELAPDLPGIDSLRRRCRAGRARRTAESPPAETPREEP